MRKRCRCRKVGISDKRRICNEANHYRVFLQTYYLGYYYITYYLYSTFEWLLLVRALY